MKILVATNKYDTQYFRFDTEEEKTASALKLFKLNDDLSYYDGIPDEAEQAELSKSIETTELEIENAIKADISDSYIKKLRERVRSNKQELKDGKIEAGLYARAKAGDAKAALDLIKLRKDAEYENWDVKEVQ